MKTTQAQMLIKKEDLEIITTHIKTGLARHSFDRQNVMELEAELKKATLVNNEDLPDTVVGLNSTVIIKDVATNRVFSFTIVTPDRSNIRRNMISVLAPMGTALLGFQKGQMVKWKLPSGEKKFMIMEVANMQMA